MKPLITLVCVGSGDPELLNAETIFTLRKSTCLILRTSRSPITSWLEQKSIDFSSLDELYESVDNFDSLNSMIAKHLWSSAKQQPVVYAVSDLMTDSSVKVLYTLRPDNGIIEVIPGINLSDIFRSYALPFLPSSDLRTVSATDFILGDYDPNISVLITELDNPILAGDVKIILSSCLADETSVYYFHNQTQPVQIPVFELDRQNHIDHLSAVLIPGSSYLNRRKYILNDLLHIIDRLRAPDGCPWDREQTHQSLRPFLIEEAWECIAAIDQNDPEHLAEELGDLLFQIIFHASIGKSYGEFSINDIAGSICRKMIRRHPHVFSASSSVSYSAPSAAEWEDLKRSETGSRSILESLNDVSIALPSLKYASKILNKLSLISSCRHEASEIIAEIEHLIDNLKNNIILADEFNLGRLLYLCTELCSSMNLDGEFLLHNTVTKHRNCLQSAEKRIISDGKSIESLTFKELSVYLSHVEGETE